MPLMHGRRPDEPQLQLTEANREQRVADAMHEVKPQQQMHGGSTVQAVDDKSDLYWNENASHYPQDVSLLYHAKKRFDRALIPDGAKGRILDAGCGKGFDLIYFAQSNDRDAAPAFAEICGVDFSAAMIDDAIRNVIDYEASSEGRQARSEGKIQIWQADLRKLPFDNNFFDVACSFSAIDHIPTQSEREQALVELVRVAKPGATILLTLPNSDSLPARLRKIEGLIVEPVNVHGIDMVRVRDRSSGSLAYEYEHPYDYQDLYEISRNLGLELLDIKSGVMTDISSIPPGPKDTWLSGDEVISLQNNCVSAPLRDMVERTIKDWRALPSATRGLRIGMVAKKRLTK